MKKKKMNVQLFLNTLNKFYGLGIWTDLYYSRFMAEMHKDRL